MKKSKVLIGVVALSVALMGTGYAWWTDALTVQGTVNTGTMDVVLTSVKGVPVDAQGNDKYVKECNIESGEGADKIEFIVDNMYPKSHAKLDITAKNIGTIGAKLGGITVTDTKNNDAFVKHLQFSVDGKNYVPLDTLNTKLMAVENVAAEVKPNEQGTYSIYVQMPENVEDAEGKAFETLTQNNTFVVQLDWVQFNYEKN